ncbi:MAG: relaxase/mobilization nuclease domain-containing protein [Alistipes sp.]|nr:relaxase/mobilization nuclease domain-containing protein [Alistipes sp.]
MIAKGKAVSYGANAIGYAMREDKMDRLLETNHIEGRTPGQILKEMERVNANSTRCKNKYLHFQIGIAPQDRHKLNTAHLTRIAWQFGQRMGLQDNQWIAVTHKDTKNLHIHFIANRIGLDGKVYNTTFVSNRASRVAEQISQETGLTIAKNVNRQAAKEPERMEPKRQLVKENLTRIAYSQLPKSNDLLQFFKGLEGYGIGTELARNKKGNIYGVRFSMYGETYKASDIGKEFGLHTLSSRFGLKVDGAGFSRKSTPSEQEPADTAKDNNPGLRGSYSQADYEETERIRRRKKQGRGI